jgi:hypothetical protein
LDNDSISDGDEVNVGTNPNNPDTDGDTLYDIVEILVYGTDPTKADTDDDGLDDNVEIFFGIDPLDADSDDDGLSDGDEALTYHTNPLDADTDNDGLEDGVEVAHGTDPLDSDSDNDGIPDGMDVEFFQDALLDTPSTAFKNANNKGAMMNDLDSAENLIRYAVYFNAVGNGPARDLFQAYAMGTLTTLLSKLDGCPSAPDSNDHVIDCGAQLELRPLLLTLINNVEGL